MRRIFWRQYENVWNFPVLGSNPGLQFLVYLPQMWSMKTQAMNRRDMTRTGTGPLQKKTAIQNHLRLEHNPKKQFAASTFSKLRIKLLVGIQKWSQDLKQPIGKLNFEHRSCAYFYAIG